MTLQRLTFLVLMLCVALSGCEHEDPCGGGVSSGPGTCKPAPAADAGAADAAADSGENYENTDSGAVVEQSLGTDCAADGDCKTDAPFCARMPGAAMGYCTVKDCSTTDDQCPTGYKCFNIGIPSVPAFCSKQ